MTIIIDANCAHRVKSSDADGAILLKFIISGKLPCVTGGKHKEELAKTALGGLLQQLQLAGVLMDVEVDPLEDSCNAKLRSDDPHIVALALSSGCRLLFTHDQLLIDDFTDVDIVPRPRGKIFKYAAHVKLLEEACR